ncbi:MAG: monovalent cation/H+ antiporter complex subunit F [Wenzhouxiangella sp.]|jgi:multicomponent Na+:H+ antiporter subunit F|nr:monovalent cation/H+ antiporter complex subunit F [Wenzhouxiangella sp.]
MMDIALPAMVLFLIINLVAGMLRVYRGPTLADRMLAALLFSTTTVAALLILAEWMALPSLRNVALLIVMLASILSLAFVGLPARENGEADEP